jgi:hypothetical protein
VLVGSLGYTASPSGADSCACLPKKLSYAQATEEIADRWGGKSVPNFATLRLTWEPRMLSILRIMVGLLFLEHGLAKILDFPHPQTMPPTLCSP